MKKNLKNLLWVKFMTLNEAIENISKRYNLNIDTVSNIKIWAYESYKQSVILTYDLSNDEAIEWAKEYMTADLTKNFTDLMSKNTININLLSTAQDLINRYLLEFDK